MGKTNRKMEERWLRFFIRGEGLRASTRSQKYSYAGPIYYGNGYPIARLVILPGWNYACLNKFYVHPKQPVEWTDDGKPKLALNLTVPCVGAFSSYDGDWLTDTQLHERLRNLWMLIASHQVERAKETAAPTLFNPDHPASNGRQQVLRGALDHVTKEYEKYNAAFQLGWHSFPTIYKAELETIIENRKRVYFSPVEVSRRERRDARAGAKTALGLDK